MKRDTYYTLEGWMTGIVVISACLQLASGWTVFRNREGRAATHQTNTQDMQGVHSDREPLSQDMQEQIEQLPQKLRNGKDTDDENDIVFDIDSEGPLSDVQLQILQVLLNRFINEDKNASAEMAVDDLVKHVQRKVSHRIEDDNGRQTDHHGRRYDRSANRGANARPCTFVVSVPVSYRGICTSMGRGTFQVPACDFMGNSTHTPTMMLWATDCPVRGIM